MIERIPAGVVSLTRSVKLHLAILALLIIDASTLKRDQSYLGKAIGFGSGYSYTNEGPGCVFMVNPDGSLRRPTELEHPHDIYIGISPAPDRREQFTWDLLWSTYTTQAPTTSKTLQITPALHDRARIAAADALEADHRISADYAAMLRQGEGTYRVYHPLAYAHNCVAALTAAFLPLSALLNLAIWRRNRRIQSRLEAGHCTACDYDLNCLLSSACPECGTLRTE
jgi:hypothetical protein